MGFWQYSTTPASNASVATGINMATGSAPSTVHPSMRQLMADVATVYDQQENGGLGTEWTDIGNASSSGGVAPTYISASSFSVPGNVTSILHAGRRLRFIDNGATLYGTIVSSAYSTVTTVTVTMDSGVLDANLTAVFPAILRADHSSVPYASYTQSRGDCRLTYGSVTTVLLKPYKGNLLTIAGVNYLIPPGGVQLVSPTMNAGTLYYIYAYMNAGTMTLVASTVGHQTDTGTGVETWVTDNTHTLVGMSYCQTANSFTSTSSNAYVRTWHNDPGVSVSGTFSGNSTYGGTGYGEINGSIRNNFAAWQNEIINVSFNGQIASNTINGGVNTAIGFNSATSPSFGASFFEAYATNASGSAALSAGATCSEGANYLTIIGSTNGTGTGTWVSGSTLMTTTHGH